MFFTVSPEMRRNILRGTVCFPGSHFCHVTMVLLYILFYRKVRSAFIHYLVLIVTFITTVFVKS